MKRICTGLLAHVDAGKTTLSEALLYRAGCLKKLGRVDHKDAFLDTNAMERERGITIFSKQAVLGLPDAQITLLDTPGHVDFSGEMERTLSVLDYAVLVVSGTDGVQSHTETVWKLLRRYGVPVFVFVNKMDLAGADRQAVLNQLARLEEGFVPFDGSLEPDAFAEALAMQSEEAMEAYLENGEVPRELITVMVARRQVFPCLFGSALKLQGVDELLAALQEYTRQPKEAEEFAARVFKISRDEQGSRLTWLKVTGGNLRVKALLTGEDPDGQPWQEKADQLRVYSGAKFQAVEQAPAGTVCAVTGLTRTWAGQGLGEETAGQAPVLQPVQSCRLLLPEGCDAHAVLPGSIVYKETIAGPVEGVGHFEPLRHYAEVHLLLEPLPRGAGLQFDSICSEDVLDRNWQRLILTHLEEKEHLGVLTGSPITDMKITLTAGRAHLKHTEGGDFRQATYRAVRQGLMQADSILLEPWYEFRLEVPAEQVGRAMADMQRMGGSFDPPELLGDTSVLTGSVPVAEMRGYAMELAGYTRGKGKLACTLAGYRPCHDAPEVIEQVGYDPERDTENPADSVFCAHGAGYNVKWDEVPAHAHVESGVRLNEPEEEETPAARQPRRQAAPVSSLEEDKQLAAIFERTYGPSKGRELFRPAPVKPAEYHFEPSGPEYLLVDGYNLIFAWDELKKLAADNLEGARQALADLLCNYRGFHDCQVILVFDAYKVPHGTGEVSRYQNIYIVYTREAETADMYIEKTTYQLAKQRRVRVVTSDGAEQLIILGHGALRVSARSFREEVERTNGEIRRILEENRLKNARR